MQALVFDGHPRFASDYPEPSMIAGEAIIRPHLAGICNTDLELVRGYMHFRGVLGHEFVGTVVACDDPHWIGERVVGEINAACGACPTCRRGDASHCPERTTLGIAGRDGCMAELFSLPVACLHRVPARLPDEAAVFAEPVAAALEILEQTHLRPTDRVAVVGDGKLGLLCAQVLRLPGNEVQIVGRHPQRCGWIGQLGIGVAGAGDALPSASFDLVVDCTGHPAGLATARRLVRPRGRLVVKSTFASDSQFDMTMAVVDEVQVIGSRCGPFGPALRLLDQGLVRTEPMIAGRFPLSRGLDALQAAVGQLKMLLEIAHV
jgi:alcohol dehydrogenase